MATFYVGQRVRVIVENPFFGLAQATVIKGLHESTGGTLVYGIDVDGYGHLFPSGRMIGAEPRDLAPLIPPHEAGSWEAVEAIAPFLRNMRELA